MLLSMEIQNACNPAPWEPVKSYPRAFTVLSGIGTMKLYPFTSSMGGTRKLVYSGFVLSGRAYTRLSNGRLRRKYVLSADQVEDIFPIRISGKVNVMWLACRRPPALNVPMALTSAKSLNAGTAISLDLPITIWEFPRTLSLYAQSVPAPYNACMVPPGVRISKVPSPNTLSATPETMYTGASTTVAQTWGRSRILPLWPAS